MKKLILAAVLLLPLTSAWGHSKQEAIINDVDARLQRLQLLMDSQNLQEMYLRLEKLDQENRQLLGKVEELEHQLNQAKDRERKLYLDMDQRLGQLESGGGSYSTGGITPLPPNDSATPDYTTSRISTGNDSVGAEEAQYRTAFNLLKDKRYSESIAAFEAFLSAYPQSDLAPNAQYWMGESNYVAGRYEQAARAFDKVRTDYPDSSKVGDASLKLGFAYRALGKITVAKTVLSDVVNNFPGTKAAQLAQDQLDKWSGTR